MKKLKLRKFMAVLVDYLPLFYFIVFVLEMLASIVLKLPVIIQEIISLVAFAMFYFLFTRKDILFNGRSLGKRIFSLTVL